LSVKTEYVKLSIRAAASTDLPAMMALQKHAATAAHWSVEQYEALFRASSPARIALVVEEENQEETNQEEENQQSEVQVQGFVIARVVGAEWEIENIAIAGPARRRGLGTRLLGEFLDLAKARGAHSVFLEVRESNHAARSLYETWAFTESGRRKKYYKDPHEDAILYRLDLH
jgi:[ribosomal protein S18]-alanine N-acetyltransferase